MTVMTSFVGLVILQKGFLLIILVLFENSNEIYSEDLMNSRSNFKYKYEVQKLIRSNFAFSIVSPIIVFPVTRNLCMS